MAKTEKPAVRSLKAASIEKATPRKAGRIPGTEPYTKATVPLFNRQIADLDEIRVAIKRKTGASVMRAEIIRAALDAVLEAKIDLTNIRPESKSEDLKLLIASRLKGIGRSSK